MPCLHEQHQRMIDRSMRLSNFHAAAAVSRPHFVHTCILPGTAVVSGIRRSMLAFIKFVEYSNLV